VIEARRFHVPNAALVIHSFSDSLDWFQDFAAWCALFDAKVEPGKLYRLARLGDTTLYAGWAMGRCGA